MNISNLSTIVDKLGLSISCVIARKDLLSFSMDQLNLLKNVSRKFSRIDLLDKNYPNNEILIKFLKNGSRVLEVSLSLINKNVQIANLPHTSSLLSTKEKSSNSPTLQKRPPNDISKNGVQCCIDKFESLLNDTLISFFCIIGNSGLFLQNINLFKNLLTQISIKRLSYPGLVCVIGIISKCDLFRIKEFYNFICSIFSYFTRNYKALRYLNDLDTTLLLFHKISTLYMTLPSSPANTRNIDERKSKDHEELLLLLEVSIDKVTQMVNYRSLDRMAHGTHRHMKSFNNLVQSIFLMFEYDKHLIFKIPIDKLIKLHFILFDSAGAYQTKFCSDTTDVTGNETSRHRGNNQINNTSHLHTKIKNVLTSILDSPAGYTAIDINSNTDGSDISSKANKDNMGNAYGNEIGNEESEENNSRKTILNEIRVGSSLYFIDLLIV